MAARWLERFVPVYGPRLQDLGLWSQADADEAADEIDRGARTPGSFWVGPTVLEVRAGYTS
jgi:hypothetical protein